MRKVPLWTGLPLRSRIVLLVVLLVLIAVSGGLLSMWYTYRMNRLVTSMIDTNIGALRAAQELDNALVMQKGYVTYYFQDGDPDWLRRLSEQHRIFREWLERARATAFSVEERRILDEIQSAYAGYSVERDQVIEYYRRGEREKGYPLHQQVRARFFQIHELCEQYKQAHRHHIAAARDFIRTKARYVQTLALVAMPVAVVLGAWLAFVLLKQILEPIKRLAAGGDPHGPAFSPPAGDEIKALSHRVHSLIEDVGETKTKLELSQEHLLQSEKWAMVGKLAAGVAHSIRNPLTSVKMRLFSMERTLELTPTQKEDIEVISDEIRHLDNIVRNFLEFSRPPKLKMQEVSPSDVVDMALQLLQHRLESYEVNVTLQRGERLPSVWGDPEQLKEVMVNLLVNACEAMPEGGDIVIRETAGPTPAGDGWVSIRVTDEGPGVPRSIQDMVFQPFFTTKEEGTGLGLSIAARIVEEHEGQLTLESDRGKGACFIVSLPVQEA